MTMHSCTQGAAEAKNGRTDSSEKQHKRQQRKQHSEISVTVTDEWKTEKRIVFMHENTPQIIQECTNKSQQK